MLGRLLIGILKGVILGGLVGFGVAKLGFAAPGVIIAFVAAALTGVLVGLIAGKPIWAKDAKIEAGMKAVIGAGAAAALMYAARRWLTMDIPFDLGPLSAANDSLGQSVATVGGLAMTSLAAVGAVLGGFYEADNTPGEAAPAPSGKAQAEAQKKRIAANAAGDDDEELEAEAEKKPERAKR